MTRNPASAIPLTLALAVILGGCGGAPSGTAPSADPTAAVATPSAMPADETGLRAVLAANPWNAVALSRLSKILWDEGRHEEGVELLENARASSMRFPDELLAALALHHDALGHVEEVEQLSKALESRVSDWSRDGSALTYLRLRGGSFDRSEDVARRAVKAADTASNRNNLGIALLYAGKPEEAREAFLKAHDKDEDLPGPLYNLAIVDRFYRFDDEAARSWFRRYRELSNEDPDGLAQLLDVKVAAGNQAQGNGEVSR